MRNMSFFLTTPQFEDGSKDVTRRFGWWNLKPNERLRAIERGMGLKKGERMRVLGIIDIVSVRLEPLNEITQDECRREGFPHFSPQDFIDFLVAHHGVKPDAVLNRIEFKRVNDRLKMNFINSLPQPFLVRFVGDKIKWPLESIDVETGALRFDVCGKLQVSHIGDVAEFFDADGGQHDPESFYYD